MEHSGFFDGNQEYGQEEFNRYFDNLYESGVSIDDAGRMTLGVAKGTGKVSVGTGFAIVKGFFYYNDSELTFSAAPDAVYSRIDRIILRVNRMTGPVEAVAKRGTAGTNPMPPELQRDKNIYEISLAQVVIDTAGNIMVKDERPDQSVCGAIRPRNLTEYRDMVTKFQTQWENWFAGQQTAGWRNIYIQSEEPAEAAEGSIWIG